MPTNMLHILSLHFKTVYIKINSEYKAEVDPRAIRSEKLNGKYTPLIILYGIRRSSLAQENLL